MCNIIAHNVFMSTVFYIPFNIMALYETHIKIVLYFKKLCYKKSGTQTRKADLETSRLFYDRF